jgi:hypothetical protein
MPEAQATPRATPAASTTTSEQGSTLKTPKDKNCPFCGQSFTSSSLGRHLDLYIRPKNPKPSDGVHLVDEIRKIRGSITRRQVKSALKKEGTPAKRHGTAATENDESPSAQSPQDDDDDDDAGLSISKQRQPFRDVSWSGVRSHTPRALVAKTPDMRRDVSRMAQKQDLDQRQKLSEAAETAKATELALRELLRSVGEANAKATSAALFDFDPYTLNFPSLCLQILPPPSTLFSPTPFPTSESWSIHPPGQKQLEALNRQVRERLLAHQRQRQINQAYPSGSRSNPSSGPNSPLPTPPLFEPDPQKLFCHIADAFNHWMHQPEQTRQEYWQVEILRSYTRAQDQRREAETQLENARREIEYLKSSQWSDGGWEAPPVSISLGNETVKELGKHGMDFRNWDYDRIIDKWKMIVRDHKHVSNGMAAQKPLPGAPSSRNFSTASMQSQAFVTVNGQGSGVKIEQMPFSAPATVAGAPESDQVDAEGEDEDDDIDLDVVPASNNVHMEDRTHSLSVQPIQPTPINPVQMHAHLQSQAHAHAQAQVQTHAQAQAQVHAHAQAQAQAWAVARQHMNQSRNQHHYTHQQLSPHPQHMGSAPNSRRPSAVLIDPHSMNPGGLLPMDSIDDHQDQFLRMDMSLPAGFVTSNADAV